MIKNHSRNFSYDNFMIYSTCFLFFLMMFCIYDSNVKAQEKQSQFVGSVYSENVSLLKHHQAIHMAESAY